MSVTAGVSDVALAARAKLQGGISQTRVGRYWPGKAPKWAKEAEEDHDHVWMHTKKVDVIIDDDLERNKDDDPRLRRLGQTTRTENRERVRAEVVSTKEEDELKKQETVEEEEDVDALEERRRRIREKNLKRTREEADLQEDEEEEEVQEEDEESEYETDSEEDMFGVYMMKPFFVRKAKRETIAERERMEAEEEALEELAQKKLEMRKIETKAIVVEEIRKDKNTILEEANLGDVDTDDETNEAEEYEAWKTRELGRIKSEKDAREAMSKEKEEVDKLRNMTEQERKEWESNNPKPSSSSSVKPKKKWKFMQRYYHKGAYFQEQGCDETDGIFQRDYSAPTGVDRLDKSVLREVMHVKHFGRSGGTKWTHLAKEDTTYGGKKKNEEDTTKDWSDPWVSNVFLRQKYKKRVAAMDAPIARPSGSKKMKAW